MQNDQKLTLSAANFLPEPNYTIEYAHPYVK